MTDLPSRLKSKIALSESGCWMWTNAPTGSGYPTCKWEGKTRLAHRLIYTLLVGEIPAGMQLDHLCSVPMCVNPDHLEPVTPRENTLRSSSRGAIAVRTNRCIRGHDLAVHGYVRPDGQGRKCNECQRFRRMKAAGVRNDAA